MFSKSSPLLDFNEDPDTGIALEIRKRSKSSPLLDFNEDPDTGIALEIRKRSKSSALLDFNEDPDTGIARLGSRFRMERTILVSL